MKKPMTNIAPDQNARESILNSVESFIVQAPAGSGKTELLTQRYLLLLAFAERAPEEIIAITFTRKAAAEMRARVLASLNRGTDPNPPEGAHARKTWELARLALEQDKAKHWNILNNSQRLRITTIDSLCSSLVRKMPVVSSLGSPPEVDEDLSLLYQEAAQSLLKDLDRAPYQEELSLLLRHLDNQLWWFEKLLVEMLRKREQWLDAVSIASKQHQLREILEYSLQAAAEQIMQGLQKAFPVELEAELLPLLQFALNQKNAGDVQYLNAEAIHDLKAIETWREVAQIMLDSKGNWRKSVNVKNGFPVGEKTEKLEFKAIKERMQSILAELARSDSPNLKRYEVFKDALLSVQKVQALTYQEPQWKLVQALLVILPVAVQRLKALFAEHAKIDFNEISLAALEALGNEEEPTELALSLDYQIRHLLIDEFQDTSQQQFQLLRALVRGWEPGDGRTLFLVGDPMQSIYRFRQADVSLFIQAKNYGVGNLKPQYVQLTANFRSDNAVIDWVNHHFEHIFPLQDDMIKGAVSYRASVATRHYKNSEVGFIQTETALEEAEQVCAKVKSLLEQAPEDNIAILVRSRSHLEAILPALQAAAIHYQAVEIESINERLIIRDLLSLTYALSHLGDRLSWLALLRAPFCGLDLVDLSLIAKASLAYPVWQVLQDESCLKQLSETGRLILSRVMPILSYSIAQRDRLSLRQWVEKTWLSLKGPQCLTEKVDLDNAESFFNMLETVSVKGRLPERELLEQRMYSLKAGAQTLAVAPVQIMTIHKAKGLEFDSVIIPGLGRGERLDSSSLLLWESYTLPSGGHGLLMAPVKSRNEPAEPIYNFIDDANKGRKEYESQRLLYVAVTRAKKRLYLLGQCYFSEKEQMYKPRKRSFLDLLWPQLQTEQFSQNPPLSPFKKREVAVASAIEIPPFGKGGLGGISRPSHLSLARLKPLAPSPASLSQDLFLSEQSQAPLLEVSNFTEKAIGTLVHRYLAEISQQGLEQWPLSRLEGLSKKWANELRLMGVSLPDCEKAAGKVQEALNKILQDEKGRWILAPHAQAYSEYALMYSDGARCNKYIVDRTFVDHKDQRWIIDYKTSKPKPDQNIESFMLEQKALYQNQLETYGKILKDKKIQYLGLYFPMIPSLLTWEQQ
jgi:ATP-dependent exoDNAse (exonuclease V) beta subunit